MYIADVVFLAIVALLLGMIAWACLGPKKRRRWQGHDDNGSHMRPDRNEDGQGGGGLG